VVQGLPEDDVSIDSAILVTQSMRWPLLLDPQLLGQTWLQAKEAAAGLVTLHSSDAGFHASLEQAVRAGTPVLLCDVGEQLDSSLDALLKRETISEHGRSNVRLNGANVEYNHDFRLYLATQLPSPHFAPEVHVRVAVINFAVTPAALTAQLLADTVRHAQPALQQRKDDVVVALAGDRQQLQDVRGRILATLSEATGNILDDDALVATLDSSKITSARIAQSVELSEAAEREIDAARAAYLAGPQRASLLFFEVAALPHLSPMYHFSLAYFKRLYAHCLDACGSAGTPEVRRRRSLPMQPVATVKHVRTEQNPHGARFARSVQMACELFTDRAVCACRQA
jgi:dynein heavy chain, axonemal